MSTASPSHERDGLGWLILIPLGCLVLTQILFAFKGTIAVLDGALADTDAYMRMVRVQDLHASGDWFDARLERVNPPEGHVQHWTRPLDALILAGAWLLRPFLGFADALHVWGALISPVFLALTVVALSWATAPILGRDARLIACLALLLQLFVMAYTIVGRPDHHSLLLLLCMLLLGLTARLLLTPSDTRASVAAGAVTALAIWVSPESLVFVATNLAGLGIYWLLGDRRLAAASRNLLGAATVALALGLVVERGPFDLLAVENDRLSILHIALFALLTLFWTIVTQRPRLAGATEGEQPGPLWPAVAGRLAIAAGGVVAVTVVMLILFPELRSGPLGKVDPFYYQHRFQRIVEFQPVIRAAWLAEGELGFIAQRFLQTFGIGLLALPFLGVALARRDAPGHRVWVLLALFLAAFVPLGFYQQRWSAYAQLVLVVPYGAFVFWLLEQLTRRVREAQLPVWRPLTIAAALFWPVVIPQVLPQPEVKTAGRACPIEDLAPTLERVAAEPRTILAWADYSPALLYRTRHSVLSIPNHRPQPGFTATHRILTTADPDAALAELRRRGIDWILLCPSEVERKLFATGESGTLYRRLVDGRPPAWLEPLELPADVREAALLFAVRTPAPSVATTARP